MSATRFSYIPQSILTTSSAALAGSNGAVTFLNVPREGQSSTLSSTATFKLALPRSSTSGQGSQLDSVNVNYSIEDNNISSVTLSLSTQAFAPGSTITPIPATQSGFTLTPGNYTGVYTVDTPAYANDSDPEYFLLTITVVVDTSITTELRINDIELVYTVNAGGSFPSNVNIPGYLNAGSTGPPPNTNAGDTSISGRLQAGALFDLNVVPPVTWMPADIHITQNTITSNLIDDSSSRLGMLVSTIAPRGTTGTRVSSMSFLLLNGNSGDSYTNTVVGFESNVAFQGTNTTYANVAGLRANMRVYNTFNITAVYGLDIRCAQIETGATGTIGFTIGLAVTALSSFSTGVATVTTAIGVQIRNPTIGSSTITNNYGIDISPQSVGTTINVGMRIQAPSEGVKRTALQMSDTGGTSAGGIAWGNFEFNLYRSAANTLTNTADHLSRHYLCSSVPTVAAGAGAGTTPIISITGTDHGFAVTLTTGTTATSNATLFTVTFGASWTSTAPSVTWCGGNAATAALANAATPFTSAITTTTMTFTSNTTALADSTDYVFRFTAMR